MNTEKKLKKSFQKILNELSELSLYESMVVWANLGKFLSLLEERIFGDTQLFDAILAEVVKDAIFSPCQNR